jgi:ABC-type phosphate transport system permease subunit
MLSEKDKDFISYWEKEREKQNSFTAKLVGGLPMAILFCSPVLLFITAVYLFFPEWYTRISNNIAGSMPTIVIALIICTLFFSYFRMQYKWEMNEQYYRELKHKENKTDKFADSK